MWVNTKKGEKDKIENTVNTDGIIIGIKIKKHIKFNYIYEITVEKKIIKHYFVKNNIK